MGIVYGNGIGDQQVDGHWTCASICLIEAITGNLDIPGGGGSSRSRVRPAGAPAQDRPPFRAPSLQRRRRAPGYAAGMSRLIAPEFPRWYQDPATWESGPNSAYFKALMTALTDEPIRLRAALAQSTNPLSATRQPKKVAEALRRLDLYVVHDTHWNPSCAFADYVLPACTQYECSQQFAVKNFPEGTFVAINQKIAEPPGEACSDWEFLPAAGRGHGLRCRLLGRQHGRVFARAAGRLGRDAGTAARSARGHLRRASGGGSGPARPVLAATESCSRGFRRARCSARTRFWRAGRRRTRRGFWGRCPNTQARPRGLRKPPSCWTRIRWRSRTCMPTAGATMAIFRACPTYANTSRSRGFGCIPNGGGPRCGRRRLGARRVAARLGETGGRNDADHSPRRAYGAAGLVAGVRRTGASRLRLP